MAVASYKSQTQNLTGSDHCPPGMSPACCKLPCDLVGGALVSGEAGGGWRGADSQGAVLTSEFGFFDQLMLSPPLSISSLGFLGSCGFCFVFPELES